MTLTKLVWRKTLEAVVEDCVNSGGVDVNTAYACNFGLYRWFE